MELSYYFKTPLEQTIEDYYFSYGILTSEDLTIERVAETFGVEVYQKDMRPFSDNEMNVVVLSTHDELFIQRKAFFHELGHVLRHAGDQRNMPKLFYQLQEADADRFSLYSSMPFFMLEQLPLPAAEEEAVGMIAEAFKIPGEFAQIRLTQIKERIASAKFLSAFTYIAATQEMDAPSPSEALSTVKGIYGYEDFSRPHTLVVERKGGFDLTGELHIEVSGSFKSCDSDPLIARDGAFVTSGDLSIPRDRDNCLSINLNRVAWRHGQRANRLFIPMQAVDDVINF